MIIARRKPVEETLRLLSSLSNTIGVKTGKVNMEYLTRDCPNEEQTSVILEIAYWALRNKAIRDELGEHLDLSDEALDEVLNSMHLEEIPAKDIAG